MRELIAVVPVQAEAGMPDGAIGYVLQTAGPAYVSGRDGTLLALERQWIMNGGRLETGPEGALGVSLTDGTLISLGAESSLRLEDFRFDPAHRAMALSVRLERGLFSLLVGDMARLAPEAVRLRMPEGTLQVRDGPQLLVRVPDPPMPGGLAGGRLSPGP